MKTLNLTKIVVTTLSVAMLSCVAMPTFAEDAPVYDVDSYPAQQPSQPQSAPSSDQRSQQPLAQAYDNPTQDSSEPFNPGQDNSSDPGASHSNDQSNQGPIDQGPIDQGPINQDSQAKSSSVLTPTDEAVPSNLPLGERVGRLERQMQSQVAALRGQIEELNHQLQQLQTQQKAMYSDLEKRVNHSPTISEDNYEESGKAKSASADAATPAATKAAAKAQPNSAEEQQIYQKAYGLIKAKKYTEAADTFEKMLKKYPSGQFAANAHYWLGELYGLMGNNDKASVEFLTVVNSYPDSPKLADAQLKLGLIYSSQQKWSDAKSSFKKVVTKFPGTSFARLATEQLKQIKSSGH